MKHSLKSKIICALQCALVINVLCLLVVFRQLFGHTLKFLQSFESDLSQTTVNHSVTYNWEKKPVLLSTSQPKNREIIKILYWTSSYYGRRKWFGIGKEAFSMCQYSNCMGTNNRSELNISDAVLIHMAFMEELPATRLPHQKWIMHIRECPLRQPSYRKYNGLFNVTWTYHRKSDIWTNYSHPDNTGGLFVKKDPANISVRRRNYAQGRSKIVAWFVSNCQDNSGRMTYVTHLKKYMQVDIYGECGSLHCKGKACDKMLKKNYKFYLSFENNICQDYVTEKLWRAIHAEVVPVVLGGYNYSELLPPHSYIDIGDFSSAKALAKYLLKLNSDNALYNKYFDWKNQYQLKKHPPLQCNVCEYLNVAKNVKKTYDRLDKFWSGYDCYLPSEFYKNVETSSLE